MKTAMQIKEVKSEGLKHELEVTLPANEIGRFVDERLEEYGKTVKMPGFRPGKVPMAVLKQRYGRAVLGEVLEKAVNDTTAKVLDEKGLRPALQPKIEVKEFDEGKDLVYSMEVEVLPEFKVTDLKSLSLEKPVTKAGDKAIGDALERIAKQNRETKPLESDRASQQGDILLIDFHGRTKADNKPHPGMHAHGHKLELGSNQFITGFEEQLIGKKKGDKVEVEVTFPEEYHAEELAGQGAIFDVEIHDILEPAEVAVDEAFAKKLGFDDLTALKSAVEKQIQGEYDQMSRLKLKRSLLDALDDSHDFEIPQGMAELEYQNIRQQITMERQAELKDGNLEMSDEEEEELRAIAGRRVRLGLVLSEIGRGNNIQVTDQEIQRAVIQEAQRYPGQEAVVFDYYRKNRNALEALRAPVFEDKVVDFISQMATINETPVSLEELSAEEDDVSYLERKKGGGKPKTKGSEESASESKAEKPAKKAPKKKAAAE
jgi:trigger factor